MRTQLSFKLALLIFSSFSIASAQMPSIIPEQLAELTDTVQVTGDWAGTAVAISGSTAVVGAPNVSGLPGAAYVFVKPGSGWENMTQTATLSASDGVAGDDFGDAVAISGNTIVVGAQNLGAVYLFAEPLNGWHDMTETAKLTANVGTSRFGLALGISGNTVVVGAYGTNEAGTAYVYVRPDNGWHDMQQTAELLAVNKGDFGMAVAIDGETVVVGAPTAVGQTGLIYVYVKPSRGWVDTYPVAVLTASNDTYGGNFGGALSINDNTIVAGNFLGGNADSGEAYIFVKPPLGWSNMTETAHFASPNGAQGFGLSVSICRNAAIISAPFTNFQQGIVYVFVRPKTGWKTTGTASAYFQASDGQFGDVFGGSVSLTGTTALIGAYERNVARGAAYVFGPK